MVEIQKEKASQHLVAVVCLLVLVLSMGSFKRATRV